MHKTPASPSTTQASGHLPWFDVLRVLSSFGIVAFHLGTDWTKKIGYTGLNVFLLMMFILVGRSWAPHLIASKHCLLPRATGRLEFYRRIRLHGGDPARHRRSHPARDLPSVHSLVGESNPRDLSHSSLRELCLHKALGRRHEPP
jgi:hypothetical protein